MKRIVICFLKYPEPGRVKTRLAADLGEAGASELYEALAERVITEIYPLHADYHVRLCFDPARPLSHYQAWIGDSWDFQPQSQGNLGERMHAAVLAALKDGFEQVMLLGSDCVGMDETFIEGAFDGLSSHDFVVGPSEDGGYYLLVLDRDRPWLFEDMPWSADNLLAETLDRAEVRELKALQLEKKIDIDTLDDLIAFRQAVSEHHFLAKKIDQIVLARLAAQGDDAKKP